MHFKKVLTLFLCSIIFVSGCTGNASKKSNLVADGTMKIHTIDVGQGDATLIQLKDKNILIDGGENEKGLDVKNYLTSLGVTKLDVVIGTHPHSDHIGGLDIIIDAFEVKEVFLPNKIHTSKTFEDLLSSMKRKDLKFKVPNINDKIEFKEDGFQLTFLGPNPKKDYGTNLNAYSIISMIQFGKIKFLTAGDLDFEAFDDFIQSNQDTKADILQAFHHGSAQHTNTQALKDKVNPDYILISSGVGNSYGHPHKETLSLFQDKPVYRTDKVGTIVTTVQSDGVISIDKAPAMPDKEALSKPQVELKEETYIGNINSHKYHLASCGHLPFEQNRVYFESEEEAQEAGYEPSKDCIIP
ncbi:MAG: MBL fold metallo-hydrolase [Erysipelotrichaceae bacterium]